MEKTGKDELLVVLRDADAEILDIHPYLMGKRAGADGNPSFIRGVFYGIFDKTGEDPFQHSRVRCNPDVFLDGFGYAQFSEVAALQNLLVQLLQYTIKGQNLGLNVLD